MARIKELLGGEYQLYENIINEAMFRIRSCIPGIIQSYNPANNTAEVQPAIRERLVDDEGKVVYQALPLLINVPIVFPSTSSAKITFPINKNDQCLVIFSDLSIDHFWEKGSIQNPVEVRRHDLSDGIAIPCGISVGKVNNPNNSVNISYGSTSITLTGSDITMTGPFGTITGSELYDVIHRHYHEIDLGESKIYTSSPWGV